MKRSYDSLDLKHNSKIRLCCVGRIALQILTYYFWWGVDILSIDHELWILTPFEVRIGLHAKAVMIHKTENQPGIN